jgi:hypothetical protein
MFLPKIKKYIFFILTYFHFKKKCKIFILFLREDSREFINFLHKLKMSKANFLHLLSSHIHVFENKDVTF